MTAPKKKIVLRSRSTIKTATPEMKSSSAVLDVKKFNKATGANLPEKPIENRGLTPAGRVPNTPLDNPKWEIFCHLYASDRDFFGHGTECYAQAYDVDLSDKGAYFSCKASAGRLLTTVSVMERVNEILDITINETVIDKELGWTAMQKDDLGAKVSAIKEWNKLKGRITTRLQLSGSVETEATPEQLARIAAAIQERTKEK